MICVCLFSIYLIGRRVLGLRRATLVVFAMMLYPLFIGAKADRFNNYQVLLAVLPLMVWLFLRAYEKPTAKAGVLLGLAAAAATLTIYSAAFGLVGVALAAVLHPGRRRFFASPAPYVATAVFLVALSPHVVWLINNDFSSLRWAGGFVGEVSHRAHVAVYLGQHFGLLAFCLVAAAIALWPWRWRVGDGDAPVADERSLVLVIAGVLVFGPSKARLGQLVLLSGSGRGCELAAEAPGHATGYCEIGGGRCDFCAVIACRGIGLFVGAFQERAGRRPVSAVC
jgi:4-amino-4-deoxy-L-arabinose transferase-like glycosyltransferase